MTTTPGYNRLDEQIDWYSNRASANKRYYGILKVIVIIMSALIPISSGLWSTEGLDFTRWVSAGAGFLIVVTEGTQHVFQYQRNWLNYRGTAEALKHEKYLFLGEAGPYSETSSPQKLLVERTEMLISREHTNWIAEHRRNQQGS